MNFSGDKVCPGPLSGSEAPECTEGMEETTERGSGQRFLLALVGTEPCQPPWFITPCGCCSPFLCFPSWCWALPCHLSCGVQRGTQEVGSPCWVTAFWLTNTDNPLPRQLGLAQSNHTFFKGCGGFTYSCFCV